MIEILFVSLATAFCVFGNVQNDRRVMLICAVCCAATFSVFWFYSGEMTAMGITLAAMTGTFIQLIMPAHLLQPTYWARFSFALSLAIAVFIATYSSPADALPLIGFAGARYGETLSNPRLMRCGYKFSGILWLVFAAMNHNMAGFVSNVIIVTAQTYAFLRDWKGFTKPAVVTIKRAA